MVCIVPRLPGARADACRPGHYHQQCVTNALEAMERQVCGPTDHVSVNFPTTNFADKAALRESGGNTKKTTDAQACVRVCVCVCELAAPEERGRSGCQLARSAS